MIGLNIGTSFIMRVERESERGWADFSFYSVLTTTKRTLFLPFSFYRRSKKLINSINLMKVVILCQPEDYLFLKFPHELLKVQSRKKKGQIEYQNKVIMARGDVRRKFLPSSSYYLHTQITTTIYELVSFISRLKHHTEYCISQNTDAASLALTGKNPMLKYYNLRHSFLKYKFNLEDRYAVFLSINIKFFAVL